MSKATRVLCRYSGPWDLSAGTLTNQLDMTLVSILADPTATVAGAAQIAGISEPHIDFGSLVPPCAECTHRQVAKCAIGIVSEILESLDIE